MWVPGGSFAMGSDDFYPEERPTRRVTVEGLWVDRHPVTNADFAAFVEATGHVTVAERRPDPADYPGIDPAVLVPGSLVFSRPPHRVPLHDVRAWWAYVPGASWAHPEGPASTWTDRSDHPVVHVAFEDAQAYADWTGGALPTEAEWEFAARGGLESATFPWGDELLPGGRVMANTWQGEFPWQNLATDGHEGTSPVGTFPANGYGLYDVVGNVWEWTVHAFGPHRAEPAATSCCGASSAGISRRVVKGGSHLCAPNYCLRYRPAAREGQTVDTSTSHIGFRCIQRVPTGVWTRG